MSCIRSVKTLMVVVAAMIIHGCGAGTPLGQNFAPTGDGSVDVVTANDVPTRDVQCREPPMPDCFPSEAVNLAPCRTLGSFCGRRTCFRDRNGCQVWAYSQP